MYGVKVGTAKETIPLGTRITTFNTEHSTDGYAIKDEAVKWDAPEVSKIRTRTFLGYPRKDGRIGTRNYWLVIPLVFCENRNLKVIQEVNG